VSVVGGGLTWDAGAAVAAIALLGAYVRFWLIALIREEHDKLLTRINGTYIRSMDAKITGADIDRRLVALESVQHPHSRAKA
jgi:hypothetical protein